MLMYIPKDYVLKMPYPNPFNPKTKIAFYIPKDSKVEFIFAMLKVD